MERRCQIDRREEGMVLDERRTQVTYVDMKEGSHKPCVLYIARLSDTG